MADCTRVISLNATALNRPLFGDFHGEQLLLQRFRLQRGATDDFQPGVHGIIELFNAQFTVEHIERRYAVCGDHHSF